jgi:hypothetical protein
MSRSIFEQVFGPDRYLELSGDPPNPFDERVRIHKERAEREKEQAMTVEKLQREKDGAYRERNQCAALIARMALALGYRAGVGEHPAEDKAWEGDWRTILFVDLPTGQLSWHFHDSEWPLLAGLPRYEGTWDGHSTLEKYRRAMAYPPAPKEPPHDAAPAAR